MTTTRAAWAAPTLLCLSACLSQSTPGHVAPDASSPPGVLEVLVRDILGRPWPRDAAPRVPVLLLRTSGPLEGDPEPFLLISGEMDDAVLDDLARPPLTAATLARSVPAIARNVEDGVELRPLEPLPPGRDHLVAVGGWASDRAGHAISQPFAAWFHTGEGPAVGATVLDSWPADGTAGVAPNLTLAAVRFDGEVRGDGGGARLLSSDGTAARVTVSFASCERLGWRSGRCLVLEPTEPLEAAEAYRIVIGSELLDATGAPVGPWESAFQTSLDEDDTPPTWLADPCGLDEVAAGPTCAVIDDRSAALRMRADEPVRAWLAVGSATDLAVAARGQAELVAARLAAETEYIAALRMVDLAGHETVASFALRTTPPLAPLAITEVLADPHGPEPRQEYVEVHNGGATPLDLLGFALADRADHPGDVITRSFVVPAGGRALVVSDAFDPDDGVDVPVPPGVVLVRIGSSIASGGLSNGGEPLFLRDPEGRRVSAAPSTPAPRRGVCLVRIAADGRTGAVGTFAYDPDDTCTPGLPNGTP